jgi:hypothetical protein
MCQRSGNSIKMNFCKVFKIFTAVLSELRDRSVASLQQVKHFFEPIKILFPIF